MRHTILLIFAIFALFFSCAKPQIHESRAVHATVKTPQMAFSQSGFINELENHDFRLQLYASGQPAEELRVGDQICKGFFCLAPAEFNARFLSPHYPPNLLRDLLAARPIEGLENSLITRAGDGFAQTAAGEKYDISYTKEGGAQRFGDTLNRIVITIKEAK